jgi:hypothetical protein
VSETFSEDDLRPSGDEVARARRDIIDRAAATVAIVSAGLIVGGMVALGACAAPAVFDLTPAPFSGNAMGAAFARFDRVAIGASVVMLAAEVVRTFLARRQRQRISVRIRRLAGIFLAMAVAYIGLSLSPAINEMHLQGVRRGEGEAGAQLEATHERAELVGKLEIGLGLLAIALHVLTIRGRSEDDDADEAEAPLPPGPGS